MTIPLEELINYDGNAYVLTSAVIKRAAQITATYEMEDEKFEGKIVSSAINEVLTKKVDYRLED